ncbi:hypothetical protein EJB05_50237, partial [Eragrostis curvula]
MMRWDAAEAEGALKRILDLHDRLSDAILAASRAHLLLPPSPPPALSVGAHCSGRNGCVFIKGGEDRAAAAAGETAAEARSLHAIRSALEDVEDHLDFLHVRPFRPYSVPQSNWEFIEMGQEWKMYIQNLLGFLASYLPRKFKPDAHSICDTVGGFA